MTGSVEKRRSCIAGTAPYFYDAITPGQMAELSLALTGWGIAAPTIFFGEQALSANSQRPTFNSDLDVER